MPTLNSPQRNHRKNEQRHNSEIVSLNFKKSLNHKHPLIFHTHDNGGRPFKVAVTQKASADNLAVVKIYSEDVGRRLPQGAYKKTPCFQFESDEIFVGHDPRKLYENIGNTIIAHWVEQTKLCRQHVYVYIGDTVKAFTTRSMNVRIVKYVSAVGNSDVPYPFAVDNKNNHYLLLENIVILSTSSYRSEDYEGDDKADAPYQWYYENSSISNKQFEGITAMFFTFRNTYSLGDAGDSKVSETLSRGNFTYSAAPFKDISPIYLERGEHGVRHRPITERDYNGIRKRFASLMKFKDMDNVMIKSCPNEK